MTKDLQFIGQLGELSYNPDGLSFDEWFHDGKILTFYHNSLQFAIGDWLLYGEQVFADKFDSVIDELGFSDASLNNFKSVAKGLPPSRRRENVSYSIHAEVKSLPVEHADKFLEIAAQEAKEPLAQRSVTVSAIRDFKTQQRGVEPAQYIQIHKRELERLQDIARQAKNLLETGEVGTLESAIQEYEGKYGVLS
jgi:hypothetical protein